MEMALLLIRLFLFGVFALAAIGKLLDLKGSEKAVKEFGTPEEFAKFFAVALPFAEIVFAVCLLFPETAWLGAVGALFLLLSFIGGMAWQLSKGRAPECHCFGQIHSEPVSRSGLIRNVIFAILAGFLVIRGSEEQGAALIDNDTSTMATLFSLFGLVLTAAAILYLKRILDQQGRILRRLEVLEIVARDGLPVDRETAGDPHDGLPIGSPFPDFELETVGGGKVQFRDLLSRQKPILFLFVSPSCGPCKALLPEAEDWRTELSDRLGIVLISEGTIRENSDKFGGEFGGTVLVQGEREIAERVRARWTPTALLVRSDGAIASRLAAGDRAIRMLVDRIRGADIASHNAFIAVSSNGARPPRIGQPVPEFSLPSTNGIIDSFGLRGRRTLAVFWSSSCSHCVEMMEELKEWEMVREAEDPALLVFADDSRESLRSLGLSSAIAIDKDYSVSEKLGMSGTPSAVLIDETGVIASDTAKGAPDIWALIGRNASRGTAGEG